MWIWAQGCLLGIHAVVEAAKGVGGAVCGLGLTYSLRRTERTRNRITERAAHGVAQQASKFSTDLFGYIIARQLAGQIARDVTEFIAKAIAESIIQARAEVVAKVAETA